MEKSYVIAYHRITEEQWNGHEPWPFGEEKIHDEAYGETPEETIENYKEWLQDEYGGKIEGDDAVIYYDDFGNFTDGYAFFEILECIEESNAALILKEMYTDTFGLSEEEAEDIVSGLIKDGIIDKILELK